MVFGAGIRVAVVAGLGIGLSVGGALAQTVPAAAPAASGQQQGMSTVRGVVADPDAAVIPGATVTLTPASGRALITKSGSDGSYAVPNVPPGTYSLTITMENFATFVRQGVRIAPGQSLTVNVKMAIQEADQVVQVTAQANTLSVDQDSNASSTVIKGKDLEALSDDPDELSSELTALAGPAAGPNGGQIYVDGFTGGQLPPKSSIREIRVNQNPFSAQYDRLGYGRVEVFTKPGTDKFHGSGQLNANDSSFNTANPLLATGIPQPAYHTIFGFGNLTGPLTSFASFTVGGSRRAIQDNAIVNGFILAPANSPTTICAPGDTSCNVNGVAYQAAVSQPQTRWDITPRLDLALGAKNTLVTRFQYESNTQVNSGVGTFVLQSAGSNVNTSETTLQMSDTQIISSKIINETRFEYQRARSQTTANDTTDPTVTVQQNFTTGGSANGTVSDTQNHFEAQNYTSIALAKNFIRFGGRLRTTAETNTTTAGQNGIFTYSSLANYQANAPSQFSINQNNGAAQVTYVDFEGYAEDDWKVRPNLTFSYGVRYEVQNFITEHHDLAPRLSFAYGLGSSKGSPKTVLRGGFGIFYDRFQLANQLTTVQQNGVIQVQKTVVNPAAGCSPSNISLCLSTGSVASGGNTVYTAAPNLRSPYTLQFAIGADQQIFRNATLSVNYLHATGDHQFISQVASYIANPTGSVSGTVPINYQFQSAAVFRQNQVLTNFNVRRGRLSLFGYYALNFAHSDTSGATSFSTVPGDIGADYGRASFDTRSRLFLGGSFNAPYHISLSPFLIAGSGTPYSITTGNDTNGDSVFNDRAQLASGASAAACTTKANFVVPATNSIYTPLPVNSCTGPALFTMNLRVSKVFGFGPETGARAQQGNQGGGPGGPPPGGGRGGPGGGGRGGPGGGGPGGFGGASTGRRYNLNVGAQFQNLFNYADLSTPIGSLTSRQFGTSTQLAGGPYTSGSAVARIQVFVGFNF